MSERAKSADWDSRLRRWARIPKWQRRIVAEYMQVMAEQADWTRSFYDQMTTRQDEETDK